MKTQTNYIYSRKLVDLEQYDEGKIRSLSLQGKQNKKNRGKCELFAVEFCMNRFVSHVNSLGYPSKHIPTNAAWEQYSQVFLNPSELRVIWTLHPEESGD